LPLIVKAPPPDAARTFKFEFTRSEHVKIGSSVCLQWLDEIYGRTARISVGDTTTCEVTISEAEDQAVYSVSCKLADVVGQGLDLIESNTLGETKGMVPIAGNAGLLEIT
jgi:hypothetical protein